MQNVIEPNAVLTGFFTLYSGYKMTGEDVKSKDRKAGSGQTNNHCLCDLQQL
jgi:hypothetical protein